MEIPNKISKILLIDAAATTGWAIAEQGKKIKSGIIYLGGSSLDSHDTKTFNMVAWLDSMVINHDLDDRLVIIKELVYSNPKKPSAAQPLYHYEAGIAYWCQLNQITLKGLYPQTLKSVAGVSKKQDIIKWVESKGYKPKDDNQADAIVMAFWAQDNWRSIINETGILQRDK